MRKSNTIYNTISGFLKKHPVLLGVTILSVILSVVISVIPPLILAQIIDSLTRGITPGIQLIIMYLMLILLEGLSSSGKEALLSVLGEKMTHYLRSGLAVKLHFLEAETLLSKKPGETAALFTSDVDTIESLFSSGVISMFSDTTKIVSLMAVIAVKNTGLFLILLFVLPLLALFTRHVQKSTLEAEIENRKAVEKLSGEVPETVHNIRTIHNLFLENYMERRYTNLIEKSRKAVETTNFYDSIYSPLVLTLNCAVIAAVMLLSASGNRLVLTFFGMSTGTAVAVINYISSLFAPVESLGMELQEVESAMAGVKRINTFLSLEERKMESDEITSPCGGVKLENVTFGYTESPVLKNFSLNVKEGEHVIIRGRTGAGKSTIFKLLLGLYKPHSGRITVSGIDADKIPDGERRKIISCVEQHFKPVRGSVIDQITLHDSAIAEEDAVRALALVGLEEKVESFPSGYRTECSGSLFSEGEWELLSIARAVASNPKILLLDEITAGLDSGTERRVLDALDKASIGRSVISISHRPDECGSMRIIDLHQ